MLHHPTAGMGKDDDHDGSADRRPHLPITSASASYSPPLPSPPHPTSQRNTEKPPPAVTGEPNDKPSPNPPNAPPTNPYGQPASHVGGDGAELHGVLRRLGPRLRGHRPHAPPPGLRPRPQARIHLRPRLPLAHRRRLRLASFPQGAGGGVAAGAVLPEERARGRGLVLQDQVRQGGRRRRALPAQGGPQGLRRGPHQLRLLRPPPRSAPGQVHLPLHCPQAWERGDEARRRGQRDGVCAHVRGQGRRLDARRGRPLENVCGDLPAYPSHEKLRGCQSSTKSSSVRRNPLLLFHKPRNTKKCLCSLVRFFHKSEREMCTAISAFCSSVPFEFRVLQLVIPLPASNIYI